MSQGFDGQLTRTLNEVKNSNACVEKIIDSARKLLNEHNVTSNEYQRLSIKIDIEKDQLANSFFRINTPQNAVQISVNQLSSEYAPTRLQKPIVPSTQTQFCHESKRVEFPMSTSVLSSYSPDPSPQSYLSMKEGTHNHSQQKKFLTPSSRKTTDSLNGPSADKSEVKTADKGEEESKSYKDLIQRNSDKLSQSRPTKYQIYRERVVDKYEQKRNRLKLGVKEGAQNSNIQRSSRSKNSRSDSPASELPPNSLLSKSVNRLHSSRIHTSIQKERCQKCFNSSLKRSRIRGLESENVLENYHLVRKYLTKEGEQECYNFLRGRGIPEDEWPVYVTQYVYKQLSKIYNQPRQE